MECLPLQWAIYRPLPRRMSTDDDSLSVAKTNVTSTPPIVYCEERCGVAMQVLQPPDPAAARGRSVLTLGDTVCGPVFSEGGEISAPVIREPAGGFFRKRLGQPAPEPIVLSLDLSLNRVVYDWIAEFWQGKVAPRSGSLISVDQNNQAKSELVFEHATITATAVPDMDAASKTPSRLTVRLNAEKTLRGPASGTVIGQGRPSKPWLPANFRLDIDGLDTTRVSKIERLTAVADEGAIDFGDLRVLLPADKAESWFSWHKSFVVDGIGDEKSGTLAFLAPDLKTELGSVTLRGLGIHRLTPEPAPDQAERTARLGAELYCERMALAVHGSREPSAVAAG